MFTGAAGGGDNYYFIMKLLSLRSPPDAGAYSFKITIHKGILSMLSQASRGVNPVVPSLILKGLSALSTNSCSTSVLRGITPAKE